MISITLYGTDGPGGGSGPPVPYHRPLPGSLATGSLEEEKPSPRKALFGLGAGGLNSPFPPSRIQLQGGKNIHM